jgi:HAD superfamily hydrolase (TIGR01549 family)
MKGVLFDLDNTLVDTSIASQELKDERWADAEKLIPRFKLYDGIRELFDFLQQYNICTGVVSTSPKEYCKKVLDYFSISCGCIVGKQDGVHDKPNPDPMLKALKDLKLEKWNALSIGDRAKDIHSSKMAGIVSVGCLWGSQEVERLKGAFPEFVINHPVELIPIVTDFFRLEYLSKSA